MSIHDWGVCRLTAPPVYHKLLEATVYSTDLLNGYLVVSFCMIDVLTNFGLTFKDKIADDQDGHVLICWVEWSGVDSGVE